MLDIIFQILGYTKTLFIFSFFTYIYKYFYDSCNEKKIIKSNTLDFWVMLHSWKLLLPVVAELQNQERDAKEMVSTMVTVKITWVRNRKYELLHDLKAVLQKLFIHTVYLHCLWRGVQHVKMQKQKRHRYFKEIIKETKSFVLINEQTGSHVEISHCFYIS